MADLPACYCDSCGITAHPEKFYPDRAVQRDVMEVLVKCGYHAAGCPWVGQLKAWENHVDVCKYHTVSCLHRGCEVVLPYNRLESHQQACQFRRVTCEYCKTEISISQLKPHLDECPKHPIPCKRCQKQLEREMVCVLA